MSFESPTAQAQAVEEQIGTVVLDQAAAVSDEPLKPHLLKLVK